MEVYFLVSRLYVPKAKKKHMALVLPGQRHLAAGVILIIYGRFAESKKFGVKVSESRLDV